MIICSYGQSQWDFGPRCFCVFANVFKINYFFKKSFIISIGRGNMIVKFLAEIFVRNSSRLKNHSKYLQRSQNISKYIGKSQNILFNINCGIPCSQTSHYTQNLRNLKFFIHKVTVPMKNYFYVVFWCFCAILKSLEDQLVLHESIHHINRERKYDCGVLLSWNMSQSLQVSQLQGSSRLRNHIRSFFQSLRTKKPCISRPYCTYGTNNLP